MGIYRLDIAIDGHAQRKTSYHAFLSKKLALERQRRLAVCTGSVATRLDVDGEAGLVRGVYIQAAENRAGTDTSNRNFYVKARREVIMCCGAFKTPQILMLSGIGPSGAARCTWNPGGTRAGVRW